MTVPLPAKNDCLKTDDFYRVGTVDPFLWCTHFPIMLGQACLRSPEIGFVQYLHSIYHKQIPSENLVDKLVLVVLVHCVFLDLGNIKLSEILDRVSDMIQT